jgi:glycosyltransferase involved in cell wall biosynthesis
LKLWQLVRIVSLDCPSGPSEVLDNGRFGVLVPPHKDYELRDSLVKIMTDSAYRDKLRSLSMVGSARFDHRQMIASWERLLLELH